MSLPMGHLIVDRHRTIVTHGNGLSPIGKSIRRRFLLRMDVGLMPLVSERLGLAFQMDLDRWILSSRKRSMSQPCLRFWFRYPRWILLVLSRPLEVGNA